MPVLLTFSITGVFLVSVPYKLRPIIGYAANSEFESCADLQQIFGRANSEACLPCDVACHLERRQRKVEATRVAWKTQHVLGLAVSVVVTTTPKRLQILVTYPPLAHSLTELFRSDIPLAALQENTMSDPGQWSVNFGDLRK